MGDQGSPSCAPSLPCNGFAGRASDCGGTAAPGGCFADGCWAGAGGGAAETGVDAALAFAPWSEAGVCRTTMTYFGGPVFLVRERGFGTTMSVASSEATPPSCPSLTVNLTLRGTEE